MTAKKAAAKKTPAKKSDKPTEDSKSPQSVTEAASPEMEGEAYQVGYHGVSSDDEDYSVTAQVAKLSEG